MRLSAGLFVFAFAKRTWQKPWCLCAVGLLSGCFVLGPSTLHANEKVASLCALQDNAKEGEHVTAQVAGVYFSGLDMGPLEDANCPANATWVELALQSEVNKKKLRGLLERYGRAYVVFDGEFYGPPVPDPKLPEAIRKAYHPGWGHLASFRTKLVVHSIRVVERAPAEVAGHADNLNLVAERLARVGIFAFGGVGYAGVISKGETDFRFILSQPPSIALAWFERLYADGSAQAKAYALVGVRKLDPGRYKELLAHAETSTAEVEVMRGCVITREPLNDVAKKIDAGEFLSSKSRPN